MYWVFVQSGVKVKCDFKKKLRVGEVCGLQDIFNIHQDTVFVRYERK